MRLRTLMLLITLFLLLCSCSSGYTEQRDISAPLDELAELPVIGEGMELMFDGTVDGERVLEIRSDVSARWDYESRLDYLWYKHIDTEPEMEDRVTTYLHPTGWRVAIYDNRRNDGLKKKYGTDDYVWQVRICKIKVNKGEFPQYPESGKVLWFDEQFYEEYEELPADKLPENYPGIPEGAILTDCGFNERGLHFTFITTFTDFSAFLDETSKVYAPSGYCYADEDNNYFYTTYMHITVIEPKDESEEESSAPEISYPEEILKAMDKTRHEYYIEELPKHYDENGEEIEPNINDFWKITILFVKSEWVPEWWSFD